MHAHAGRPAAQRAHPLRDAKQAQHQCDWGRRRPASALVLSFSLSPTARGHRTSRALGQAPSQAPRVCACRQDDTGSAPGAHPWVAGEDECDAAAPACLGGHRGSAPLTSQTGGAQGARGAWGTPTLTRPPHAAGPQACVRPCPLCPRRVRTTCGRVPSVRCAACACALHALVRYMRLCATYACALHALVRCMRQGARPYINVFSCPCSNPPFSLLPPSP